MFQRIIVPIDGSDEAWEAAGTGALIASECDAGFDLVTAVDAQHQSGAIDDLERGIEARHPWKMPPKPHALVPRTHESIGAALARYADETDGSMIVMSSSGRGRSAAVLGSVADEVLRAMFGPIVVIGPNAKTPQALTGDIIVPVDGSEFSELSLPLAGAWGIAWGATPWVVEVVDQPPPRSADVLESSYPHRLANDLRQQTHHDVEFEVLHGPSPARAIVDFATLNDARFIMMSTHGRTGYERLAVGSIASSVVHEATCPVVLHRPPRFAVA